MQLLSIDQLSLVSGGIYIGDGEDSGMPAGGGYGGGGFDIGWSPAPIDNAALQQLPSYDAMSSVTISGSFSGGISTAVGDCANGAEVGAMVGAASMNPAFAMAGAAIGCVLNTGIGIIRDLP